MARIAVIGGTGYAGSHIVAEAVSRGHTVVSVARSVPAERIDGATYIEGTLLDVPGLVAELEGVDVIVSAVAPRGDMLGQLRPSIAELAGRAARRRAPRRHRRRRRQPRRRGRRACRRPALVHRGVQARGARGDRHPGGPRRPGTAAHDWFYIHPAGGFGAWNPGERTGSYRDGGDVIVTDDDGRVVHLGRRLRRGRRRRDRGPEALARAVHRRVLTAHCARVGIAAHRARISRRQTRSRQSTSSSSSSMTGRFGGDDRERHASRSAGAISVASSRRWRSTSSM